MSAGAAAVVMPELEAFAFGATLALTVGPITLLILSIAARNGLEAGIRAAIGAGLADLTLALLALLGGTALVRLLESAQEGIRLASAIVLIGLGLWLGLAARNAGTPRDGAPFREMQRPLLQIYVLTLANPLGVLAFVAFGTQLPLAASPAKVCWYALFLFLGSLPFQILIALAGRFLGRAVATPRSMRALNWISAAGIFAYGIHALVPAIRMHFGTFAPMALAW